MKKRTVSILLSVILALSILPATALAGSLSNFSKVNTYNSGMFTDVPSTQWYADEVQLAYEYGLMNGKSGSLFEPDSNLKISEAIKLAACLHSIYNTGTVTLTNGTPLWYRTYVDYALANGIITAEYPNYDAYATRADFAMIFAKAMPAEALTAMNTIKDNAIPDVQSNFSYGPAVYLLYRAGVLTGSGTNRAYNPNNNIKRSEVSAIAARMANTSYRQTFTMEAQELTATEIAAKCSTAVFYLEFLSKTGEAIRSGSGFFISENGLAITNYHVIKNMQNGKITMKDGKTYDVAGVIDYNVANDLALIQINGSGFPFLQMGNSDAALTGANIYAIGYPLGIDQTVTPGTITNASHTKDGVNYIMINASISHGSSGGALVDSTGQVIGVTSAYYSGGQNLNLAVPINLLSGLSSSKTPVTLQTLFGKTLTYYSSYPSIPDFGAITGAQLYDQMYNSEYQAQSYLYSTANISGDIFDIRDVYLDLLDVSGFEYDGYAEIYGYYHYGYYDMSNTMVVTVGVIDVSGTEYIMVTISHAR